MQKDVHAYYLACKKYTTDNRINLQVFVIIIERVFVSELIKECVI